MTRKPQSKSKLSDAERHARFVAMAKEVAVDESPGAFDRAFDRVIVQGTRRENPMVHHAPKREEP
jgi:hypothetical protein